MISYFFIFKIVLKLLQGVCILFFQILDMEPLKGKSDSVVMKREIVPVRTENRTLTNQLSNADTKLRA